MILSSALQAIVNLIDHRMSLQEAVEAPRVWTEGGVLELEEAIPEPVAQALIARGAVGDFRAGDEHMPDILRFGFTPLYLGFEDVWNAVGNLAQVLEEAVKAGGSTLRDFANAEGGQGYFQHRFDVYGREGEPCDRCGTPVRRVAFMNRSSYFCPVCQRPPRSR